MFSLIWCLFLTWIYDVLGNTRNKWQWYYLLLFWFIAVSGFQYMVGSDIPLYMDSYGKEYNHLSFEIEELGGRYQPGWYLLNYICRQITDNFLLFKIIQAIFINIAVFSFFKRESKYVFLCVTLYAITTYLILNFNSLRQSFAIGFMLYYISYLKNDRYVLAILSLFGAFMFHNTAIVGIIFLIFKFLKYGKRTIALMSVLSLIVVFILMRLDIDGVTKMLIESGYFEGNIGDHATIYLESSKYEARDIRAGIIRYSQIIMVCLTLFYYVWKKKDMLAGGIGAIYLFLQIMSFSIPIVFRLRHYFDMSFYVMFSFVVIEISSGRFKQLKQLIIVFCLVFYSYFPFKEYFTKSPGVKYRYIDQYYPYVSVFNSEDVDHDKINYFQWL